MTAKIIKFPHRPLAEARANGSERHQGYMYRLGVMAKIYGEIKYLSVKRPKTECDRSRLMALVSVYRELRDQNKTEDNSHA